MLKHECIFRLFYCFYDQVILVCILNQFHFLIDDLDETEFENSLKNTLSNKKESITKCQFGIKSLAEIEPEKEEQVKKFEEWMISRRYSTNTIQIYTSSLKTFFRFFAGKRLTDITNNELITFNNQYILANGYSATLQNQVVNALKLFYSRIPKAKLHIEELERPRRSHPLPNVLSKEEIAAILNAPTNIKHRAIFIIL